MWRVVARGFNLSRNMLARNERKQKEEFKE
jgi:hypothetical protein